jgi:hypothetical protein
MGLAARLAGRSRQYMGFRVYLFCRAEFCNIRLLAAIQTDGEFRAKPCKTEESQVRMQEAS